MNILNKHTILSDCSQPPDHLVRNSVVFFLNERTLGEKMKAIALIFLLICTTAHADDTVAETEGELMSMASYAGICGYGLYHNPDGDCVTVTEWTSESTQCPKIKINNIEYPTHVIDAFDSMFMHPESSGNCLGMYSKYAYDSEYIVPVESGGDFLYSVTSYAGICGYGEYHLNGVCYDLSELTDETRFGCDAGSHMTVATDASFMGPKDKLTNPKEPRCNGDYSLYDFVVGTNSPSLEDSRIYPLYNGTLLFIGANTTDNAFSVSTFEDMRKNKCSVNGDNYYNIDLLGETTSQPFAFPSLGMCDVGFSKFVVEKNCHRIETSDDIKDNWLCGVLCEQPEYVYTNSGVCSTNGYCMNGDSQMRLHVARPDGEKYSYPLYASKTSTPALNFKFLDKVTNEERMCYVNLVPPDAINHFVGVKPNPIRVGKSLDWTDSSGTHTTTNLITID